MPKILELGDPWGTAALQKGGEDLSGIDMYHRAKFHPIGATVAEISVAGQRKTSASARHISTYIALKTMCNTLAPFSRATLPSLTVCLCCLAYCRLLKLTPASNAGNVLQNTDRYLLIVASVHMTCDNESGRRR